MEGDNTSIIDVFINQTPGIAAIISVVILFLRHISESRKVTTDVLKTINDSSKDGLDKCSTSLDRNTEMLGRTTHSLERMETSLEATCQWRKENDGSNKH